ncbi:hypothetical protein CJT78_30470, partial [Pseudomonas aeruginosa]
RLSRALRDANEHREQLAVLFIDSDRFKEINDRLGHAAGDTVLPSLSRIGACMLAMMLSAMRRASAPDASGASRTANSSPPR